MGQDPEGQIRLSESDGDGTGKLESHRCSGSTVSAVNNVGPAYLALSRSGELAERARLALLDGVVDIYMPDMKYGSK